MVNNKANQVVASSDRLERALKAFGKAQDDVSRAQRALEKAKEELEAEARARCTCSECKPRTE